MTHGDILEPARFDGCPEPGNSVSGFFFYFEFPNVWFAGNCEQTPKGEVRFFDVYKSAEPMLTLLSREASSCE